MKHGDLVLVPGYTRKWVALLVTKKDLMEGLNATRPGLYLFSGYWYPEEGGRNPLNRKCYGKILPACGCVVGRMTTHWAARALCS